MRQAFIITGASRGFGRSLALAAAKAASPNSHFVLSGKDEVELGKTADSIRELRGAESISVNVVIGDLSDVRSLSEIASNLFDRIPDADTFSDITFFNNAGSLGPLAPVGTESHVLDSVSVAFNINITAACFLTSEFVKRLSTSTFMTSVNSATVVNVSSLAAVQPFESWSVYCAGKAARDMYHKVLAEEQKKAPVRSTFFVVNYAPGPLDTNMQKEIRENPSVDKQTQEYFVSLKENKQLVDADVSAEKLVVILRERKHESGSHVDYYDLN